jgi:hypothetical protein
MECEYTKFKLCNKKENMKILLIILSFTVSYFSHANNCDKSLLPAPELVQETSLSTLEILKSYGLPIKIKLKKVDFNLNRSRINLKEGSILAFYRSTLKKLVENLDANSIVKKSKDNITSVFYPMAGYDAQFPFTIFPNAKLVIGLDRHRFLNATENTVAAFVNPKQGPWEEYSEIKNSMAPKILGNIFVVFPKAVIQEVGKIILPDDSKSGYVRFLDGNGNQRIYIHVADEIGYDINKMTDVWWGALFPNKDFAIVLKASMGMRNMSIKDKFIHYLSEIENGFHLAPSGEDMMSYDHPDREKFKSFFIKNASAISVTGGYGNLNDVSVYIH